MGFLPSKYDFIIGENGINSIEKVFIGGIEQSILIQAEDGTKPVLLFVHGGPSMPLPGVSSRGRDYTIAMNVKELVKEYVVVFWDQRGTGKSYHDNIPKNTMTVTQFVSDTIELTDYLRKKFSSEKIFLVGHSWGTVIGLHAVTLHPQKYHSYVGLSQVVNWTENDRLGLKWAKDEAARRGNLKALRELDAVGEPPFVESFQQWAVLRKWQRKFGTLIYSDENIKHPGMLNVTMTMLRSKDYSLKDIINTFFKGFILVYTDDFVKELPNIDFKKTAPKAEIPVTFIHGSKDVHVHGELVKDYFQTLDAKNGKDFIWMEKSGHAFHPDDAKIIEKLLIEQLQHYKENNA